MVKQHTELARMVSLTGCNQGGLDLETGLVLASITESIKVLIFLTAAEDSPLQQLFL